jgi:hypothetical protein
MQVAFFQRDFTILFVLALLAYFLDLATANGIYKDCMNFISQASLLSHHFIMIFSLFAWLSNNTFILLLNFITIVTMWILWYINDDICIMDLHTQADCNTKTRLRAFFRIMYPDVHDAQRIKQKTYLTIVLLITVYKLLRSEENK